jgi:hypothetical protein
MLIRLENIVDYTRNLGKLQSPSTRTAHSGTIKPTSLVPFSPYSDMSAGNGSKEKLPARQLTPATEVTPSPARIVKLHQRQKLGIIPQQPRNRRGLASVARSKLLTSRNHFPRHEDIGDDNIATNKRRRGGKAQDTSPRTDECSAENEKAVQGQCVQG